MREKVRWLAWLMAAIGMGCAGVGPRVAGPGDGSGAALMRAEELLKAGCYACLVEARELYAELFTRGVGGSAVEQGVFGSALLAETRRRELGMNDDAELRPVFPDGFVLTDDSIRILEAAELIQWQEVGVAVDLVDAMRANAIRLWPRRTEWVEYLETRSWKDPVAAYVYVGLQCRSGELARDVRERLLERYAGYGFVVFRIALCESDGAGLIALLDAEPAFGEAHFFLGRMALDGRRLEEAERHLSAVAAPEYDLRGWPAPVLLRAGIHFDYEEYGAALEEYELALATMPALRAALLGKGKTLSYLRKHGEAIGILSDVIGRGQWFLGDALYWRAWNYQAADMLDVARRDVERARLYRGDVGVLKLAGIIALRQGRLEDAAIEFTAAVASDPADCEARYHLGQVRVQERMWQAVGSGFAEAWTCFGEEEKELREVAAALRATDSTSSERDRQQLQRTVRAAEDARRFRASSAYNAALGYFNAGRWDEARARLDLARRHEEFLDRVLEIESKLPGP